MTETHVSYAATVELIRMSAPLCAAAQRVEWGDWGANWVEWGVPPSVLSSTSLAVTARRVRLASGRLRTCGWNVDTVE